MRSRRKIGKSNPCDANLTKYLKIVVIEYDSHATILDRIDNYPVEWEQVS